MSRRFDTTRWPMIFRAGQGAGDAFASLCEGYWGPIYWFFRAQGVSEQEAEDFTQGFFEFLMSRKDLAKLDPALGRFRSWFRTAAKRYLLNQRDFAQTEKRGGKVAHLRMEGNGADDGLCIALPIGSTPEQIFDRHWALTVIARAIARTRRQYEAEGRLDLFECLREGLGGADGALPPETGTDLKQLRPNKSPGALRVDRHRLNAEMKDRYRDHLRAEVGGTVSSRALIGEEIQGLIAAVS